MKIILAGIVAALFVGSAAFAADHAVRGYTRADGTYVQPHMQTNPNSTTSDNYSTRGNVNPYTGEAGTKPDSRPAYGYTQPAPAPTYGVAKPSTDMYGNPVRKACATVYGC